MIGSITALGGGTIREFVVGESPPYFGDVWFSVAVLVGVVFAIVGRGVWDWSARPFVVLDSLGLVVFAFVGAERAVELQLGLVGIVFAATATAVGGGIVRDVILNRKPEVMHRGFYASVAMLLGVAYFGLQHLWPGLIQANVLIVAFLLLRVWALRKNIQLWRPGVEPGASS